MTSTAAEAMRARLRPALAAAIRADEQPSVRALRSAVAALDNAEAVDRREPPGATARFGAGAADVPRRRLSDDEVKAVLRREVDDRRAAARQYEELGRPDRARELEAEAAALERFTG